MIATLHFDRRHFCLFLAFVVLITALFPFQSHSTLGAPLPYLPPNEKTIIRKIYLLDALPVAVHNITTDQAGTTAKISYLFADHLGSVGAITDSAGHVVERPRFDPFGQPADEQTGEITSRGFTGHHHAADLGLIYMNARWYDPGLGRFLAADTIVPNPAEPQSFNRYSYGYNNPVRYVDPSGHIACDSANLPGLDQNACDAHPDFVAPNFDDTFAYLTFAPPAVREQWRSAPNTVLASVDAHAERGYAWWGNTYKNLAAVIAEPLDYAITAYEILSGEYSLEEVGVMIGMAALPFAQGSWGDEALQAARVVDSRQIFWSQNGVSWATGGRSGIPLDDLSQDIATKWNGPPLRVIEIDGSLVSLDNRRLTAAKVVHADVPVQIYDLSNPEIRRVWQRRDGVRDSIRVHGRDLTIDMQGGIVR